MRQVGPEQAEMRIRLECLRQMRVGEEDYSFWKTRVKETPPNEVLRVVCTNDNLRIENNEVLKLQSNPIYFLKAKHHGTAHESSPLQDFRNLRSIAPVAIGQSVMLLYNLNTNVGLANGSIGILRYCVQLTTGDEVENQPPCDRVDVLLI